MLLSGSEKYQLIEVIDEQEMLEQQALIVPPWGGTTLQNHDPGAL